MKLCTVPKIIWIYCMYCRHEKQSLFRIEQMQQYVLYMYTSTVCILRTDASVSAGIGLVFTQRLTTIFGTVSSDNAMFLFGLDTFCKCTVKNSLIFRNVPF